MCSFCEYSIPTSESYFLLFGIEISLIFPTLTAWTTQELMQMIFKPVRNLTVF